MQHSPARSTIDVGSVIAGTYTIEALIGRGGMGAVFLASHTRLPGKKVAVKVLHAEMDGEEILARFKREAQIASMLSHPNIVHVEDYNVTAEGMPYLVLEYLQGESLAQRLRRGPMTVEAAFSIIRQVGSALAAAHAKGIVHRDLKPQNIFIVPSEIDGRTMDIAKVLDFGISKMRDSQTVKTQESALLGTPQYMAPEQAMGQHERVDERTDIFALGAIVYEMLSGQPAFSGQTIPEVVFKVVYEQPIALGTRAPDVSATILTAVDRAMAKPAEDRYDSVTTFVEALTGAPVSVIRSSPSIRQPPVDGSSPTSASGSAPNSEREAFAKTVGSGEHGLSPMTATASASVPAPLGQSSVPGQAPIVDVAAVTIASQDGRKKTAPPFLESESVPAAAPAGGKRTALIAGGVLAAAVAAAGIMYAVMRQPPEPPAAVAQDEIVEVDRPKPPVPQVEKDLLAASDEVGKQAAPTAATAETTAAEVAAPADAPRGRPDAKVLGGKPANVKRTTAAADSEPGDEDTFAGKKLRLALTLLQQQQWEKAAAAATEALTTENTRPKQRGQATMILGVVACHTNDEEAGRRSVRALGRFPVMRTKVLDECHALGYLESIPR